jgi:hypothetical protein
LHAARVDEEAVEAVVRPGVRRLATAERGAQRPERVLVARAALREVRAEERELLDERPDPDPEDEPAARGRSSVP